MPRKNQFRFYSGLSVGSLFQNYPSIFTGLTEGLWKWKFNLKKKDEWKDKLVEEIDELLEVNNLTNENLPIVYQIYRTNIMDAFDEDRARKYADSVKKWIQEFVEKKVVQD